MANSRTVLIDFHSLAYRNLFSVKSEFGSFQVDAWNFFMVKSIIKIVSKLVPFTDLFFCVDSPFSWRKIVYKDYKGNRIKKPEDAEEWKSFYAELNNFVGFIDNVLPFYSLCVEFAEGDDIISSICRDVEGCVIVSPDKDFIQCLKYGPDIEIYDPMKDIFISCEDPERQLQVMCYTGDKSDNIPNVKKGVGPKRAEKIIDGCIEKDFEVVENERFNRFLIDLDFIPLKINEDITAAFFRLLSKEKAFDVAGFDSFCRKNNIESFLENIKEVRKTFTEFAKEA